MAGGVDVADLVRRFAWGFGLAGLGLPLLIEALWQVGLMELLPPEALEWLIVVWPWLRLLVHAEEASPLAGALIWIIAVVLNVMLYAAAGGLVGALVGLARRWR